MKVRILKTSNPQSWACNHVGEDFEVLEVLTDMLPQQYKVDISRLVQAGEIAASSRGIGYLFSHDVEKVVEA